MTVRQELASSEEIHAYLLQRLNLALRRPGMMGRETGIRLVLDHLLAAERRPEAWEELRETLDRRGAWTSVGVSGAFEDLLPGDHGCSTASVYAEFARRQGWLETDRLLDAGAYAELRAAIALWTAQDRTWSHVEAAFGPPSVLFGGTNPYYGKVLGYASESPQEPMVFFHLWNGTDPGAGHTWPPPRVEPLLLAVRCGDGPFADTFTFTPEGRRRPG
ncbi:hypothetical protein [Kitasatospora arboriphila]|uniref:Uncharacterized protein n=1 Tax=Kitasatospora arboriphila TaxID=258052 RepID=A0ABP4E0Q6_9ACTN